MNVPILQIPPASQKKGHQRGPQGEISRELRYCEYHKSYGHETINCRDLLARRGEQNGNSTRVFQAPQKGPRIESRSEESRHAAYQNPQELLRSQPGFNVRPLPLPKISNNPLQSHQSDSHDASARPLTPNYGQPRLFCTYCKKTNHTVAECRRLKFSDRIQAQKDFRDQFDTSGPLSFQTRQAINEIKCKYCSSIFHSTERCPFSSTVAPLGSSKQTYGSAAQYVSTAWPLQQEFNKSTKRKRNVSPSGGQRAVRFSDGQFPGKNSDIRDDEQCKRFNRGRAANDYSPMTSPEAEYDHSKQVFRDLSMTSPITEFYRRNAYCAVCLFPILPPDEETPQAELERHEQRCIPLRHNIQENIHRGLIPAMKPEMVNYVAGALPHCTRCGVVGWRWDNQECDTVMWGVGLKFTSDGMLCRVPNESWIEAGGISAVIIPCECLEPEEREEDKKWEWWYQC